VNYEKKQKGFLFIKHRVDMIIRVQILGARTARFTEGKNIKIWRDFRQL